jgi:hypothetical protein
MKRGKSHRRRRRNGGIFVTSEAKGYARFMRSHGSRLARLVVGAVLAGVATFAGGATILYRWVDADGVTHYADRPVPGAQRVQIARAQTYQSTPSTPQPAVSRAVERRDAGGAAYTRLEITSPAEGAVIVNSGGKVDVAAAVEPGLAAGQQLWFILDGQRIEGLPPTAESATLDVPRGTHNLAVSITDAGGRELLTSAPVSFVVRQSAVANPPRGPALPQSPGTRPHP